MELTNRDADNTAFLLTLKSVVVLAGFGVIGHHLPVVNIIHTADVFACLSVCVHAQGLSQVCAPV